MPGSRESTSVVRSQLDTCIAPSRGVGLGYRYGGRWGIPLEFEGRVCCSGAATGSRSDARGISDTARARRLLNPRTRSELIYPLRAERRVLAVRCGVAHVLLLLLKRVLPVLPSDQLRC